MKKKVLIILPFLALASCQPLIRKIYGIKTPKIENQNTINDKALAYGLDTSNIVSVNSKEFLSILNNKSIPDGAVYDSKGNYIEYKQSDRSCNSELFQFIPALNLKSKYNQPDRPDLKSELTNFRDLKGNLLEQLDPADFYLLIYWSVWTGKLNKDHVKVWEDLADNNNNCEIRVVKVNLDIQEYWPEQERKKIIEAMNNL